MSVDPSQRNRKTQSYQGPQGVPQNMNISPREASPSPSFRERQRAIKGQSVPLVYSHAQQPSPTMSNSSHQSKRSPPPSSRISPTHVIPGPRDLAQERPVPMHSFSQPDIRQGISPPHPPPPPQHSMSQSEVPTQYSTNPVLGYPRPINRAAQAPFLTNYEQMESSWQMTDELMAEIERADLQQTQAAGTFGVAYAGGAASGAIVGSPPKDYTLERIRSSERASPKDSDGSQGSLGRRQGQRERPQNTQGLRDSPTGRPLPTSTSPNSQLSRRHTSPDGLDSDQTAVYNGYEREYYPAPNRVPPPLTREGSNVTAPESGTMRGTPPAVSKLSGQTPPAQAAKARTPDRSLPVQEEPEEDLNVGTSKAPQRRSTEYNRRDVELVNDRHPSPTPSSDIHPEGNDVRYSPREDRHDDGRASRAEHREDDDVTLNEHSEDDHDHQHKDNLSPSESESYTPRSPTADLPAQYGGDARYGTPNADFQQTIRAAKTRGGITDQLGLRGLEQTFETMLEPPVQQSTRQAVPGRQAQHLSYTQELQNFFDESAYLQAYMASPRPGAPVPPTPHSQTAAPSPSPLISGLRSELGPSPAPPMPIGSPYPYPFTHIRRAHGHIPSQQSSNYDPNHPAAIQEQLARQMQIYAMNNAAIMSDSTLSPSSTPFPGPGYNPWAFLPTTRHLRNGFDASMSIQSSPSHEPLELLPPRIVRGKSLKHTKPSSNLRAVQTSSKQRKPPPRVESTQPRDTSPDNTSGEETAGEEKVEEPGEVQWVNGVSQDDTGEWVDEEDEDEDDEDLLDLEFHPTYIGNPDKRRRKWDTRWDELVQAFQALDRQTDTTLVLLASPPHSTKLHALTSRSIKRDPSLRHSPAMASIRTSFTHIASQRRITRSRMTSLVERLALHSDVSADGSDVSSSSREEDLKRALEAALGSLGALGNIYEQREARWRDEMRRISDERERVELLLRQTLGSRLPNGDGAGHTL
ncbi:hypothetical protein OE88DRAFT_1655450 [Heliocybe sulcata]|uniref:Uncharacterized protein n=1 Tax=Heliocybe sulcata TaxID=5364 RepID=A0A5C3N7P7_9AGAM|nr:hypothetical protein OE88DRAFT_1655450 [Heliocybe sulcata]